MPRHVASLVLCLLPPLIVCAGAPAEEPLHTRIDALIRARADGRPASTPADDAEFLRRVYLDLAGTIPAAEKTRAFLQDRAANKRARLIDQLLNSADYPRRMQELFHVMLMERLGDNADWSKYLRASFAANKPWDQMVREILSPGPKDEATRGAAFFYARRLENYGANSVDYPGLTRDVGRLFLGIDLRCAQCHDHRSIKDYKQQDFQGLFAFFQNCYLVDAKTLSVGEKAMLQKIEYASVFKKVKHETGPKIFGLPEIEVPTFKKGDEYLKRPDPKTKTVGVPRFSPLSQLAEQLPTAEDAAFSKNIVNRLWWIMFGRGLVHPLDLQHSDNPPSHPELLDLLAQEFVAHKFDIKWMLRELALTETYQRSSLLPEGQDQVAPESFLTALEKRLSAEQLLWSMLEATGERERILSSKSDSKESPGLETLRGKFIKAFANPPREPEDEYNASLKAALFVLNDETVLAWLTPRPGNLVERLTKLADDQVAEDLYLSVLTRQPTADERSMVTKYLAQRRNERQAALGRLVWALLASTEFSVNH